jgi:hypothetical protein
MEGNLVGLEPVTNLGGGGGLKRLRTNQVAILLPAVKEKKGEKKKRTGKKQKTTGQEHLVGSEGVVECVGT